MLPPVRTIAGNQPPGRVLRGTLPALAPARVMAQDATAPGSLYRTNPGSPAANSNERGSFTGGAVRLLRNALPINAAMFAQDMTGNKVPLTEQDLKPEELFAMRVAARNGARQNGNFIDLNSYENRKVGEPYADKGDPQTWADLKQAITNPMRRMGTTIGGAMLHPLPNGQTALTDSFDFNKNAPEKKSSSQAVQDIARSLLHPQTKKTVYEDQDGRLETETSQRDNIYGNLLMLEKNLGSSVDGKGIPVNLNLGNLKRPLPGEFPAPAPRVLKGVLPPKK